PYYKMRLRKGFFWYYLQHINRSFPVEADDQLPCRSFKSGKLLMRILVFNRTISVEFSHILTDGTGGLEFLKSILITYFKQLGQAIPEEIKYLKPGEKIKEEEFEDAYKRYFKKKLPYVPRFPNAFHLPFKLKKKPRLSAISIKVPLKEINQLAKEKNVSITTYLVAVYLMVLQDIYEQLSPQEKKKANKILRIQVPVNLRPLYPTSTMRNFSLFVMPEIDLRLGKYTFDEILTKVYYLIKLETDKKLINKVISRNVGSEKRPEVRSAPLLLKSLILNYKYKSLGANLYSGVITNLGKVDISPEINSKIENFLFAPPPPNTTLKVNCGVVGFDNNLVMYFGNISKSEELENKIEQWLQKQGIKPIVERF
ncbi:MAG: hypothetical protein ACOCXH_09210, partial [Cyclobacteriaceae bacterium]